MYWFISCFRAFGSFWEVFIFWSKLIILVGWETPPPSVENSTKFIYIFRCGSISSTHYVIHSLTDWLTDWLTDHFTFDKNYIIYYKLYIIYDHFTFDKIYIIYYILYIFITSMVIRREVLIGWQKKFKLIPFGWISLKLYNSYED